MSLEYWLLRKKTEKGGIIEYPAGESPPFVEKETVVACKGCRCLIAEKEAGKVEFDSYVRETRLYCKRCKPPYDRINNFPDDPEYYKIVPEHQERVEKDGSAWGLEE